ncbi:hypothetical protein Tco_1147673, partial [Tanacetum coccineum]
GGANNNQLLLIPKIDRADHARLEQTSRGKLWSRPQIQIIQRRHPMLEKYSRDSWMIDGWFRSKVSSIGVDQTSTMSEGPDEDHNNTWCQKGQTRTTITCGEEGAATTSKVVEDEPHSYSQLRS